MPTFLNDAEWHNLIAAVIEAAGNPADPHAEVAMLLSPFIVPECAREDIERHAT